MKTLIYFVRHGQSLGNEHRIFLGHTDMDLTDLGRRQAEATAKRLADVDFAAFYSSDLLRAYNTAKPHADMRDMTVKTDKRLRELYCGDWEGLTVEEIIERYGELYTVSWAHGFGSFRMPNGESVAEGAERMYEAALDMGRENEGKIVLCASHAAVMRALFAKIKGIAPENIALELPYPSNASYSVVEYDNGELKLLTFSEDEHLEGMSTTWRD